MNPELEPILKAIPHRPPFLLIDRVVEQTEEGIVCEKTFTGDEYFFAGHYPDFPITPGVLLCEAAMQAGAVFLSSKLDSAEGKVPVATRLNDVRLKKMVRPGDTIRIEVDLSEQLANAFFMKAKVTVDGKLAVRFEFACAMAEAGI